MTIRMVSIVAIAAGSLAGCVERELTISSEPEGALVFVSDVEVGRTPLTMPFTWYGDYDVILRHRQAQADGKTIQYQTLKTHARIDPPWYEIPPLDLLSHMAPWTYYDRRYLHYKLKKFVAPGEEQLIQRAKNMRERNIQPAEK